MRDEIEITINSEKDEMITCDILHIDSETKVQELFCDKQFNSMDHMRAWANENNYEITWLAKISNN